MPNKKNAKLKFSTFFSKHFKLIALLIVAVILVAGYFLLLGPKYEQYRQAGQAELEARIQAHQALEKYLANLKILEKNLAELEKYDLNRLNMILPKEKDLPGLFVQMEKIAEENNFVLLNIDFVEQSARGSQSEEESSLDERIRKLNVDINIGGGNYASLIRFLDTIEYNLRLMDVTSLSFAPTQSTYAITLTTYYLAN